MSFRFFSPSATDGAGNLQAVPLVQSERITLIDAIRGIALLGILLMNIPYMAMPYQIGSDLSIRNELSGPNYYVWWIVEGLFAGTMRGLFSLLFGAGSLLLLGRLEQKAMPASLTPADIYYRRMIWLLVFGLINAFIFLWLGDVLYSYALCGFFLYPLRNLKPKYLLLLALSCSLILTTKYSMMRIKARDTKAKGEYVMQLEKQKVKLTTEQQEQKKKWESYQEEHKKENVKKEAKEWSQKVQQSGYFQLMSLFTSLNVKFESTMFYRIYIWDALFCFLLGMALFKWGVLTGERSMSFYWRMMLLGYGIGLSLNYWILKHYLQANFDSATIGAMMPVDLHELKRVAITLGHLGAIVLLYRYRIAKGFLSLMANVGQMAFTNYLVQSIIAAFVFFSFGGGLFDKLERYQIYYVVLAVWVFQVIFSRIWLRYFLFGPFEWAWRSLTYWKVQPFRRKG